MARLVDRVRAFLNPPSAEKMGPPVMRADPSSSLGMPVQARYDSVHKTEENLRHWQWIDHLSADASLNPYVRIAIRARARYELHENNSYGFGMASTVVTDTIGTGPKLQLTAFSQNINQEIEKAWRNWCMASDFKDKLETMRRAKLVDGEAVARFVNNPTIEDPVMLDLQLIEADQLRSPRFEMEVSETFVDGVHLDRFGNPFAYDILRHHPGARYWTAKDFYAYTTYPLDQVIHIYKMVRPGQHRGVSEFAPALPLFAFLRRFTLATISAAETAASVSQVLETDTPIPEELEEDWNVSSFEKWMESIPIDRNSATVLPNMWKLKQFAAEHPTTTYAEFKREIVAEIGRCLCIPVNIGASDSGNSNFSSARFDWLGYERTVKCEQDYLGSHVVDRVFAEWLIEAALVGVLPRRASNLVLSLFDQFGRRGLASQVEHNWHWDGMRDADAKDAADAQKIRLQNGSTHRAREYALQGLDVEVEDRKAAESFGLTLEEYREALTMNVFANGNPLTQEQEQTNVQEEETGQAEEDEPVAAAGYRLRG